MIDNQTYKATASREGRWWVVEVHGLPENMLGVTQGRTWSEAEFMATDVVSLLLDVPADTITINLTPADPEAAAAIRAAEEATHAAEEAEQARLRTLAESARTLTRNGFSVRDAGTALGVSYQRIAQLAPKRKPGKTAAA